VGLLSGIFSSILYLVLQYQFHINDLITYILSLISLGIFGVGIVMWYFFRDPERIPPSQTDIIVSPADGKIIYVREIFAGTVPCAIKGKKNIPISEIAKCGVLNKSEGYILGICMSVLDVHITRAPIEGKMTLLQSFTGRTLSPKNWMSEIENPRSTLIFEDGKHKVIVTELGTPHISKILTFIETGDQVSKGQRIGKITWGSQVDVIIPFKGVEVLVKEGDCVLAGKTILAKIIDFNGGCLDENNC